MKLLEEIKWNEFITDNIKSIEEIDAGIAEILKNGSLEKLKSDNLEDYYENIHKYFFKLFGLNTIPVCWFERDLFKNLKVYRARPSKDTIGNDLTIVNTFSCPKWDLDTGRIGRANWRGRNVFYAGDSPLTALKETKEEYKEGNEFYIGKWGFDYKKFTRDKIQISTFVFDNISEENIWSKVLLYSTKSLEKLKSGLDSNIADKYSYLTKRISQLFVNRHKEIYPLTACIADQRIYCKENTPTELYFPILIYPSVETETKSCNFAIHPFFVQQYMRLETVFHIKLNEKNSNQIKYSINKVGFCIDNKIVKWHELDFNPAKSVYSVESLDCYSCGKKIDLNDIDTITFKKNNQEITHGDIVARFLKERNYSDFYNLDNNIIEQDGIFAGMEVKFSFVPLKDIVATVRDQDHTNLTMDFIVRQPFEYKQTAHF